MFVFAYAVWRRFYIHCVVIDGTNTNAWLGKSFTINACNASENEHSYLSRPMKI